MNRALLERMAAGFSQAAAEGRTVVDKGAFSVFLSDSPEPVLSLALPQQDLRDWTQAIARMEAPFNARNLPPRLEIFAELYPTLGDALERVGFVRTDVAPLMALTPKDAPLPVTDEACLDLATEPDLLEPFLYGQSRAYGGSGENALVWLSQVRAGLASGSLLGVALLQEGEVVAGASVQRGGEVGELAGVWTKPELRRRGLAERACRVLLTTFFAAGNTLCWLSAAPDAAGLYRKLGFQDAGTQVNYIKERSS